MSCDKPFFFFNVIFNTFCWVSYERVELFSLGLSIVSQTLTNSTQQNAVILELRYEVMEKVFFRSDKVIIDTGYAFPPLFQYQMTKATALFPSHFVPLSPKSFHEKRPRCTSLTSFPTATTAAWSSLSPSRAHRVSPSQESLQRAQGCRHLALLRHGMLLDNPFLQSRTAQCTMNLIKVTQA